MSPPLTSLPRYQLYSHITGWHTLAPCRRRCSKGGARAVTPLFTFTKLKKPNTIEGMRSVSQFSVPSFHVVGLFSWRLQIPCIHGWEFSEKNPALRLTKTLTLSDHDTPITPRQRGRVSRGFFFRDCVRAGPSVSVEAGCNLRRRGATYVKPKTRLRPLRPTR